MTVGLTEAMALLSAHRAVVEVEGEIPDILPLPVDDLSIGAVVVGVGEFDCVARARRHARAQHLSGWQLDVREWAVVPGLQVAQPDGSIDRAVYRPLQLDEPGRRPGSLESVLLVSAVEIELLAEEAAVENARAAVRRTDLAGDRGRSNPETSRWRGRLASSADAAFPSRRVESSPGPRGRSRGSEPLGGCEHRRARRPRSPLLGSRLLLAAASVTCRTPRSPR